MKTIEFHDPIEFVSELVIDKTLVEDNIVRISKRSERSRVGTELIYIEATARVRDHVVRFLGFAGEYFGEGFPTVALERAEAFMKEIEEKLPDDFDVRRGVISK